MPTEILSGLWIGDINDSFNIPFIKDNLISILINCTVDYDFLDLENIKKLRIPLSCNLTPEKDLHLLKNNKDKILTYIFENMEEHNILIYCYDGVTISPLISALFLIKYGNISKDDIRSILRSKNNKVTIDTDLSFFKY
tara:strand:+ start:202 stop:618 length:417 start_codon:yes stop_codon:yes gene_type:complete